MGKKDEFPLLFFGMFLGNISLGFKLVVVLFMYVSCYYSMEFQPTLLEMFANADGLFWFSFTLLQSFVIYLYVQLKSIAAFILLPILWLFGYTPIVTPDYLMALKSLYTPSLLGTLPVEIGWFNNFFLCQYLYATPTTVALLMLETVSGFPVARIAYCWMYINTYGWFHVTGLVNIFTMCFLYLLVAAKLFHTASPENQAVNNTLAVADRFRMPSVSSGLERMTPSQLTHMKDVIEEKLDNFISPTQESTEKACVICLDATPDYRFKPCGHACICFGCYDEQPFYQKSNCPLCRMKIEKASPLRSRFSSAYYVSTDKYEQETKAHTVKEVCKLVHFVNSSPEIKARLSKGAQRAINEHASPH
mmetsp:Transcript_4755/g.5773  ORF Transcript_4755/g.5773 Transcript_4755/m.5773 type:complete len:362 (-) Transcript_4755:18-1103(-)